MPAEVTRLTPLLRRRGVDLLLAASSTATVLAVVVALESAERERHRIGPAVGGVRGGIYDGQVYSERLGWEPRPGARFLVYGAQTSINSFGYRGEPLPREQRPGRSRVVMLGDSVAFGYGVADDQTFAHLLDPERGRFETANLAVPGYGIDQSLLRYEASGSEWRPDLVVLNMSVADDLADIMLPAFLDDGRHPKPRFSLREATLQLHDEHLRLGRAARLGVWLRERSHLYRRLARRRPAEGEDGARERWSERRRRAIEDRAKALDLLAALIGRLREDVERDGARLVLAIHPSNARCRGGARWVDRLTRRRELEGLQIVSLEHAYRRSGLGFDRVALDGVGHLNARGHRLAANGLRAALEQWRGSSAAAPSFE